MSSPPTRSSGSLVPFGNESSNEDNGDNNSNNEIVPYQSPSVSSEGSFLVDREASHYVRTWVQQNYIAEKDHNVPRKDMFEHYKGCCIGANMTPVNSATFGKLLRIVFPDLKTRRLGVRGQSKYHYCGIRLKSGESEIELTSQPSTALISSTPSESYAREHILNDHRPTSSLAPLSLLYDQPSISSVSGSSSARTFRLPNFAIPIITTYRYSPSIDTNVAAFTAYYETHCHELLRFVVTGHIEQQQQCLETFYTAMPDNYKELIDTIPEVCDSIWRWDCTLFDTIIIEALPDIQYAIPPQLMQAYIKYTDELKDNMKRTLVNYPESLYRKKLDIARIFISKFRRQLKLNQAAQQAASILTNPAILIAIRSDWANLDIDAILDQTFWVSDYNVNYINRILRETVHELIFTNSNISYWIKWLSTLVDTCLKDQIPTTSAHSDQYLNYAKSFISKWNLYTSIIVKDLGLQNARSSSYFSSLKFFLDDFLMYLVEENIAHVNHDLVQTANLLPLPPDNFFGPTNRSEEESSA